MQLVAGVFDSAADAENAREQLITAGFAQTSVSVQSHPGESNLGDANSMNSNRSNTGGFMSSVSNFFSDLFGSDNEDSGHYSEAVRRGGSVVTVSVEDEDMVDRARSALADAGAVNMDTRADKWREQGYSKFDPTSEPYKSEEVYAERARVIPVVREEREVGKREVDLGAVRVHARTESRPVNETMDLREQRADIDRRMVDRPATSADLGAVEGQTIEAKEMADRAIVNKSAGAVEEVSVGTRSSHTTQTLLDSVGNTVIGMDRDGMKDGDALQERSAGYRTHFQNNFASSGGRYEEFEPSYQYGSTLGLDSRYANRSWDDIEPQAQQDWASQNRDSKPGAWERTKAAVKHGWESATGKNSSLSSDRTSAASGLANDGNSTSRRM